MATSNLLTNQRVLVTGGGSGFGAEIARQAVNEGAKVVILDVSPTGQTVADEINAKVPGSVVFVKGSVTETAGWEAARDAAVKHFGGIDSVVNNAGWSYHTKPTLEVTLEEYNKTFDLNVKSIFLSVQTIVPLLIKQGTGGTFIQIGSVSHLRPRPGLAWYAASKGTVSTVAKSLATEFADKNIRFNTILPVLTPTGLTSQFVGVDQHDSAGLEKFTTSIVSCDEVTPRSHPAPRPLGQAPGHRRGRHLALVAPRPVHHGRRPPRRRRKAQ